LLFVLLGKFLRPLGMYLLYNLRNAHPVIKPVLFNHEITNKFDVGALITLQT